jgi:hypothetical protein
MVISGYIANFFFNNEAPSWKTTATALSHHGVKTFFGFETLPDSFLQVLFQSNSTLLKIIPELTYRNHQLIMMFLKEEYSLSNCAECGYFVRSTGFNWRRRFEFAHEVSLEADVHPVLPRPLRRPFLQEQNQEDENKKKTDNQELEAGSACQSVSRDMPDVAENTPETILKVNSDISTSDDDDDDNDDDN